MSLRAHFNIASEEYSGFSAEQILSNRGFFEIGRRTNAAAWTTPDAKEVIRISNDPKGSEAYFNLAQKMEGNPYMPVVLDHAIMKSGDHIAIIEKLENPSQKHIFQRYKKIGEDLKTGTQVPHADIHWREEITHAAIMSTTISNLFMARNFHMDINTLPNPEAFREAAVAITELSLDMHKENKSYVPSPDMNRTNVMWRRLSDGLVPVLYDPLVRQYDNGPDEKQHAIELRRRLGMSPSLNL